MANIIMEYYTESSSSSSSSSDEDEPLINQICLELFQHHQKNEMFLENIVPSYTEKEFVEHFRVSRGILKDLAIQFENSEWYPKSETGFAKISAEHSIWIFCWYAAHEAAGFRDVADRFNIAISSLHLLIVNVSYFFSNLSPTIIRWPNEQEQTEISAEFIAMGFVEGVIGCMDGVHFRIDKPKNDADSYYNRKKYFSIQMQTVCDSRRQIRDVFIGYPGSVHDARIFRNSSLSDDLGAKRGNRFILADTAYPCLRNVITPYKDYGNSTEVQTNFNQKLSRCRVRIEQTFGILKQKFRSLYHIKLKDISTICHFIRACCVLHNLALLEEDDVYIEEMANDIVLENNDVENNILGDNFRNYLAILLYQNI